jgi:hypothetical protein
MEAAIAAAIALAPCERRSRTNAPQTATSFNLRSEEILEG